jgi:hypothetical protein
MQCDRKADYAPPAQKLRLLPAVCQGVAAAARTATPIFSVHPATLCSLEVNHCLKGGSTHGGQEHRVSVA